MTSPSALLPHSPIEPPSAASTILPLSAACAQYNPTVLPVHNTSPLRCQSPWFSPRWSAPIAASARPRALPRATSSRVE
ncbi:hypothetical protein VTO73DRAFT_6700 [Trametes versicolor]